jgi:hypothetical protein
LFAELLEIESLRLKLKVFARLHENGVRIDFAPFGTEMLDFCVCDEKKSLWFLSRTLKSVEFHLPEVKKIIFSSFSALCERECKKLAW